MQLLQCYRSNTFPTSLLSCLTRSEKRGHVRLFGRFSYGVGLHNQRFLSSALTRFGPPSSCVKAKTSLTVNRLPRVSTRSYLHFRPIRPEDWELPEDTMPDNISELLKKDPRQLDFFENYWYWRVRSEATVLDPENLPRKTYRQLAYDMGMQTISEKNEHLVGLLELYEYLVMAPCVGPFGTLENPVLVPSVSNDRYCVNAWYHFFWVTRARRTLPEIARQFRGCSKVISSVSCFA